MDHTTVFMPLQLSSSDLFLARLVVMMNLTREHSFHLDSEQATIRVVA